MENNFKEISATFSLKNHTLRKYKKENFYNLYFLEINKRFSLSIYAEDINLGAKSFTIYFLNKSQRKEKFYKVYDKINKTYDNMKGETVANCLRLLNEKQ